MQRGSFRRSVYQCIVVGDPVREALLPTEIDGLQVLPANKELAGAEVELVEMERREFRLEGHARHGR